MTRLASVLNSSFSIRCPSGTYLCANRHFVLSSVRRLDRFTLERQPERRSSMAEMGVYEAMRTLRAVRRLKPDPIPDDVMRRVLEAATWAPTGGNRQPWRIVA